MSPISFSSKNQTRKLALSQKVLASLIVLSVFFVAFYLWQINDLATKGFQIKGLEEKIASIRENNKNLELQATDLQSLSNIEKLEKDLNMVKVNKVEYISTFNPVAVR